MEFPLADGARETARMCPGIGTLNPIEINVALNTAGVVSFHIMTGHTTLHVPSRPGRVPSATRSYTNQNPGLGNTWKLTVPNGFEAILIPFYPVTFHAKLFCMTRSALAFFTHCVQRMDKSVIQFVLTLDNLSSPTPDLRAARRYTIHSVLKIQCRCSGVAILAPCVLMTLRTGHIGRPGMLFVFVYPVRSMGLWSDDLHSRMAEIAVCWRLGILMT